MVEKLKKQKDRKLLIQIGAVILPAFVIMIVAVLFVVYNSTIDSYLEAKRPIMTEKLNDLKETGLNTLNGSIVHYWEEHQSEVVNEITDEDQQAFWDHSEDDGVWTEEWFNAQSDAVKMFCAKALYVDMTEEFNYKINQFDFKGIFVIDIAEKNQGFVFYDKNIEGSSKNFGEKIDLNISKHKVLKSLRDDPTNDIVFESSTDFPDEGNYFIGYKLVTSGDNTTTVLAITYDWSEFYNSINKTFMWAFFICVSVMLAAMAVTFVMLYRKAIKPVEKIQSSVCSYIQTKDSAQMESEMAKITTHNELGALSDYIAELAREIERYTNENIKLAKQQERVAAELNFARAIQASQLPSDFPAFPGRHEFDIYATMTPAKEVGGDFYDFFLVDDDHLALVIADVSDKGMPAALYMMMSKLLIYNHAMMGLAPHEVLERTSEALRKNNKQHMFVTIWLGILEISTGKITAANAGHEYPIIRQPGGEFELFKDKHGFVAGAVKGIKYTDYEFTLQKGATLFVYTDGLPEAKNADEEMFDTQRFVEFMNTLSDASPEQLLKSVHAEANKFAGDTQQFDDLTMLGLTLL